MKLSFDVELKDLSTQSIRQALNTIRTQLDNISKTNEIDAEIVQDTAQVETQVESSESEDNIYKYKDYVFSIIKRTELSESIIDVLLFRDEVSISEIAEAINRPATAVRSWFSTTAKKIRKCIVSPRKGVYKFDRNVLNR